MLVTKFVTAMIQVLLLAIGFVASAPRALEMSSDRRAMVAPGPPAPAPCTSAEILWSPTQRLGIADFRGPSGADGLSAEASTGIGSKSVAEADGRHFRITITSFFDPCDSWMRAEERNAYTLGHEQVHFDITELHARQLARRYREEVRNAKDFMRVHQRYYEEVWKRSREMQQRYDREVYNDPEAQVRWQIDIARRINETAGEERKVVVVPIQ